MVAYPISVLNFASFFFQLDDEESDLRLIDRPFLNLFQKIGARLSMPGNCSELYAWFLTQLVFLIVLPFSVGW